MKQEVTIEKRREQLWELFDMIISLFREKLENKTLTTDEAFLLCEFLSMNKVTKAELDGRELEYDIEF